MLVALRNRGSRYNNTRHNVGSLFLKFYAKEKGFIFMKREYGEAIETEKAILILSSTKMNVSHWNIMQFSKYFETENLKENFLVICDNMDAKMGKFHLKRNVSHR